MSLLTQFYPGSSGGGAGLGSFPGIWVSDPIDTNLSPAVMTTPGDTIVAAGAGAGGFSFRGPFINNNQYKTFTFLGVVPSRTISAVGTASVDIQLGNGCETLEYPAAYLQSFAGNNTVTFNINGGSALKTIKSLSVNLLSADWNTTLSCSGKSALTDVTLGEFYVGPGGTSTGLGTTIINFSGCALNQTSVDAILVKADAMGNFNSTKSINVGGGTSAAPGAAGAAAKLSLQGNGWTVTTN